ncbi:uncharacterized protein [Antedon mediterranea]|uniref:uncharacterized protein isoform X2 n=1 Tax=Antedon mediterranea TaxID=105859 RepID=UPI003AF5613A
MRCLEVCLVLAVSTLQVSSLRCPTNWKLFESNCYMYSSQNFKKHFWDASAYCQEQKFTTSEGIETTSELASVHSSSENAFLFSLEPSKPFFIGMYREDRNDDFEWVDGTKMDYENWAPNQPESNGQHVVVNTGSVWDNEADKPLAFVCKTGADKCLQLVEGGNGCRRGWPIIDRTHVDSSGWTMVSPEQNFSCSGQVTKWTYYSRKLNYFRAVIFRQMKGSNTRFKVVGYNDIPPSTYNGKLSYVVPIAERIAVEPGDMIGWSFGDSVITYNYGGESYNVRWVGGHLHTGLVPGQVININDGVQKRDYSIEAQVGNENAYICRVDDDCTKGACHENGQCFCPPDFSCVDCSLYNACQSNPCGPGGTCVNDEEDEMYFCEYPTGFRNNCDVVRESSSVIGGKSAANSGLLVAMFVAVTVVLTGIIILLVAYIRFGSRRNINKDSPFVGLKELEE